MKSIQQYYFLPFLYVMLVCIDSYAQTGVSINSTGAAPNANAILDVTSNTKGALLPRMTSVERVAFAPTGLSGMTVYDTTTQSYWYWDGTANLWRQIPNTTTIVHNTLDGAYDQGGAGAGRVITADNGAVEITGNGGFIVDGSTLLVDAANNRIGIGTATPSSALHIEGTTQYPLNLVRTGNVLDVGIEFRDNDVNAQTGYLTFDHRDANSNGNGASFHFKSTEASKGVIIEGPGGYYVDTQVAIRSNGNSYLTGGNLGLGTNAPSQVLDVNGKIRMRTGANNGFVPVDDGTGVMTWTDPATLGLDVTTASNGLTEVGNDIQLGGALTQPTTITQAAHPLSFISAITNGFSVDGTTFSVDAANNRIGIGTSSPDAPLQVGTGNNSTRVGYWTTANTDIDALVPGSGFGSFIQGGDNGHVVVGLKENDINDAFSILSGSGNYMTDNTYDRVVLYAQSSGNVAIGATNPTQALDVNGKIRMRTGASNGFVPVGDGTGVMTWTDPATLGLDVTTASNGLTEVGNDIRLGGSLTQNTVVTQGAYTMDFSSTAVDGFSVDGTTFSVDASNNRIGIGTAAPTEMLHIKNVADAGIWIEGDSDNANEADNAYLKITQDGQLVNSIIGFAGNANVDPQGNAFTDVLNNALLVGTNTDHDLQIGTNSVARMTIKNGAGNVGIGTNTPDAKLNVGDATGGAVMVTREAVASAGQSLGSIYFDSESTSVSTTDASAVVRGVAAENHGNTNKGGHLTFLTKSIGSSLATAAVERMRITQNGNVGIGSANPTQKVHIEGTVAGDGGWDDGGLLIQNTSVAGEAAMSFNNSETAANYWIQGLNQSAHLDIAYGNTFTNGNTLVRLQNNGYFGLGTVAPSTQFHTTGGVRHQGLTGAGSRFVVADASGNLSATTATGSGIVTGAGTTNYLARWTPDGSTLGTGTTYDNGTSVGIGTAAPSQTLEVAGNSLVTGNTYIGNADSYFYRDAANRIATPDQFYVQASSANTYLYSTNTYLGNTSGDQIHLRANQLDWNTGILTTAGYLGLGTAAPSGLLHVNNADDSYMYYTTTGNLYLYNPEASTAQVRIGAAWDRPGVYSSQQLELFSDATGIIFGDSNVERMRMTAAGDLGLGTSSPSADLHIYRDDSDIATVYATGTSQGSGMFFAGQSPTYGGGFVYDGDGTPALVGGSDRITFFRRSAGTDFEVMSYGYSSDVVRISSLSAGVVVSNANGDLSVSTDLSGTGWGDNLGNHLATAGIGRNAHNTGFLQGSYNNIGANDAQTNPIYTIGSSYVPATTTLGNMYGIGYTHTNASFLSGNPGGWGMYVAADGDARTWLAGSAGGASYFNAGNVGIGTASPGFKLHVPSGYIGTDYINTSDNAVSSGVSGIMVKTGDNYHRTSNAAGVLSFLGVTAPTGDNLGNHVATTNLNMNSQEIDNTRFYDVLAGDGNGIRFWQSNSYAIGMGNAAEYHYGPVTDYSIKMNMNNQAGRGWTWGVDGLTPVASIAATTGDMQIAGDFRIDGNTVIDDGAGWHRSYGSTGWYSATYGGGWYMTDATWIRSYNSKNVYVNTTLRADGAVESGGGNVRMMGSSTGVWGSASGYGFGYPSSGVLVESGYSESGGMQANGDNLNLWSPGDADLVRFYDEDGMVLRSYINGVSGAYVQASDRNKKQNIEPISAALDKILTLSGYTYEFKLHPDEIEKNLVPTKTAGVIAQEVDLVIPEIVDHHGEDGIYINYDGLTPYLIEAIKEQQSEIEELSKRSVSISDFGNTELAGSQTWVEFDAEFVAKNKAKSTPIVTVTPTGNTAALRIIETTVDGFRVELVSGQEEAGSFNWMAMTKAQAVTYVKMNVAEEVLKRQEVIASRQLSEMRLKEHRAKAQKEAEEKHRASMKEMELPADFNRPENVGARKNSGIEDSSVPIHNH